MIVCFNKIKKLMNYINKNCNKNNNKFRIGKIIFKTMFNKLLTLKWIKILIMFLRNFQIFPNKMFW